MVIQVLVTNFLVLSAIVNGFSLQSTTRGIFGRSVSKFTLEMAKEIKMPALSSTMKEGKIVAWSKNVGDKVSSGDVLLVVESDKADMDVESFEDGYLSSILTPEGGTADVGATVAILVDTPDQVGKSGLATPAPAAAAPVASTSAPAAATSSVTVSSEKILMPALSSTMKEGKIVSWAKKVGEKVSSGDILFIVESDKADMDVEAFEDGYLATIVTAEGAVAPVGSPVALIAKTSADVAAVQAQASAILSGAGASSASVVAPVAATVSASTPVATSAAAPAAVVNSGRVAASGYAQAVAKEAGVDLRTVTPARSDGFITASDLKTGSASSAGPVSTHVPAAGTINATPIARKLAAENNVDISKVKGTGNFGRVLPDDVLIFAGKKTVAPAPAPAPAASATVAAAPKAAAGGKPSATEEVFDGVKVMDGMQKAVSKNMEKTISVPIFRVSRYVFSLLLILIIYFSSNTFISLHDFTKFNLLPLIFA